MGSVKLTYDQVRLIRHLYKAGGISMREIGRMFNVSVTQISRVLKYKARSDVKDWLSDEDIRLGRAADIRTPVQLRSNRKLTDRQVIEIRDRYAFDEVSTRELAKEYCVSQIQVCRIINRKQRKDVY